MKYLILGAGPAGLTLAHSLLDRGETSVHVLEKESCAGGLCRSAMVDGAPLDTGGGHFLDTRNQDVCRFLFRFMPEDEWDIYVRDSRIRLGRNEISHPFEANIWQFDIDSQVRYLASISRAGCVTGAPKPEAFTEWIRWKLGDAIADDYMLPYNSKMFGDNLNDLGTYWLNKLPDVSFEDTLRSCLERRAYGTQPGHARFYYPHNFGYGELWRRMGEALGEHIEYGKSVESVDTDMHAVTTSDGSVYEAETIVTTIPWNSVGEWRGMPDRIMDTLPNLKHTSVVIEYHPENIDSEAQWIYIPDPKESHHRILVRDNFCPGSHGFWTETNADRYPSKPDGITSLNNEYAYPLNTADKPQIIKDLLEWGRSHKLIGLGRWGEHEHYNSDVVVERAMKMAETI